MKRLGLCLLMLLSLCGCGLLRENTYVVVEPHDEDYDIAIDSNVLTVSSYLSLKNALLNMVEDGVTEGVIRAESYTGNLSEDLSQAVKEVSQVSPLGAYAVDYMTYDYSRIVSYYEIHINTTFRRTREEIQSVSFVTDVDALRVKLREAMKEYASRLVVRVGDYESFDLEAEVEQIYLEHPEFVFELPETSLELYPESGTQRILEIKFLYSHTPEELKQYQMEVQTQLDQLSLIYGSANTDLTNARRFYNRLGRDAVLEQIQDVSRSLTGSVYGLLVEDRSTSYGFAQAYRLLLDSCDVPCEIITGQKNGTVHYWCLIEIDGAYFYVDPSNAAGGNSSDFFLMGNAELNANGYYMWNAADYPVVELPDYLKPPAE